jgi:hypothetical protein
LGRDRNVVTPGQFLLGCGSSIATAHGGTIRSAEWRSKPSRRTGAAQYPVQSAQERGTRSRIQMEGTHQVGRRPFKPSIRE